MGEMAVGHEISFARWVYADRIDDRSGHHGSVLNVDADVVVHSITKLAIEWGCEASGFGPPGGKNESGGGAE